MILVTFMLIIEANKKDKRVLERVFYIYYLFRFQKNIIKIKALIDSGSKINTINLKYALKLAQKVCFTNI